MRSVLSLAAVMVVLSVVAAGGATAATEERIVVDPNRAVTKEFGPIPGSFPLAPDVNWTPSGCATEGPGAAVCDKVPLTIPVPEVADADDYYVEISLEWQDDSDLDMYMWDDTQIDQRNGVADPGYTEVARSATGTPGEKIRAFEPDLGDYNLTIVNWAGANLGYQLTVEMKVFEFTPPFESLAPEFSGGPGAEEEAFQPFDYSAIAPTPQEPVASAPVAPRFGEVAITPDRDFTDFGSSSFEDELAAPPPAPAFSARLTSGPPPDVHLAVLLFWLLGIPLAAGGVAAFFVIRRSRSIGLAWG